MKNKDKAQAFLNLFFLVMNTPDPGDPTILQLELPWQPITKLEIQRSLNTANGITAPGEDNLPILVWKKL
jgi:hypothetical protein